MTQELQLL
ncbi:hypothetical protein E2C01_078614 [Portunus trituberculatus]|uniref:Uncharacterized protein n=1 Tax=Portunus trituberculatus TaxID=210409 RepID=A0A5B7IN67_PORTR|nr:hypothetical protein [Portunus trituberculatus]